MARFLGFLDRVLDWDLAYAKQVLRISFMVGLYLYYQRQAKQAAEWAADADAKLGIKS